MRAFVPVAIGVGLVIAGLAAPCGETVVAGGGVETAGPGHRTAVLVPGCSDAGAYAESDAFAGRVALDGDGNGSGWIRRDVRPGHYTVTAHCGDRTLHDVIEVRAQNAWTGLLPVPLTSS